MSISTLSLNNVSRASILRIQNELRDATKEAATLRHADVGATLGRLTGNAITYRAQDSSIGRILESNKLVTSRLELMDDTMDTVSKNANEFMASLINGATTATGTTTLVEVSKSGLQQLAGSLNINTGGQYLFAGTQGDVQPLSDGSASVKADFDAYLTAIGADRSTVSADQVNAYFTGVTLTDTATPPVSTTYKFDNLFNDAADPSLPSANWDLNWSDASSDPAEARISKSETIKTSLSANETAFRNMAAAYSMVASLGIEEMGDGARKAVLTAATVKVKAGIDGVTELQADVGTRLKRVEMANTALAQQQDIVKSAYQRLEGVDETEAALRITQLKTQLETSFAVTGKLQSLSILDYI